MSRRLRTYTRIKNGTIKNNKQIIEYLYSLGHKDYYRVKCLNCGRIYIIYGNTIYKKDNCRECGKAKCYRQYRNQK